ncbi:hypothetical protein PR202_ga11117 [Eleusine coracana subsp. coracana]|uniref:Uncharacterized protein n=1 Tax=Eleusine coracana subsp. coracana TaxID=191504 RepID=A0AAV5C8R6_ELECO|nr:hypothetical protein PR202_ga11117 [Eleusine coracana subsp. coracana]
MEAAALTVRTTSQCLAASAPAHGFRQRAAATVLSPSRRLAPCGRRLRALPPEISEILKPSQMVPGSPADTGDVSSLIPVRRVALDT